MSDLAGIGHRLRMHELAPRTAKRDVPVVVEIDGVDLAVVSAEMLRRALAASVLVTLRVDGTAPCRITIDDLGLEATGDTIDTACERLAATIRDCVDPAREAGSGCQPHSDHGLGLQMLASLSSDAELTDWLIDLALAVVWTQSLLDKPGLASRRTPDPSTKRHLRLVTGSSD